MITRFSTPFGSTSAHPASHGRARSLNCALLSSCLLFAGASSSFAENELSYNDVQLCTNAYNHIFFAVESIKSDLRGDPDAQVPKIEAEATKVLDPAFRFEILNLPDSGPLVSDGIPALAQALAHGLNNYGEHHVTSPFSVKQLPSTASGARNYHMTTRDLDYVNNPEGGCEVYLSQKDVSCTVRDKALLNSVIDNVVTSYRLEAPACGVWKAAPVTPYAPPATNAETRE